MIAGSFESSVEEGDLPTKKQAEMEGVTIWFRIHGLLERMQAMFARRYPSGHNNNGESEYSRRLRELEGQIADIDREQRGFRMGDYHEGGGRETSWKDWVLGLVGLAIVAWLGRISLQLDDLQEMKAEQKMMEKHLESTDSRVDRVEARVYRGTP